MKKHIKAKIDIRKSRPEAELKSEGSKARAKRAKESEKNPRRKAGSQQSTTSTKQDKNKGKGTKTRTKRTDTSTKRTKTSTKDTSTATTSRKGGSIGKRTKIRRPTTAARRKKGSRKAPNTSAAPIHSGSNADVDYKGRPPVDYEALAYEDLPGPVKISKRGRQLQEPTRKLVRQIFNLVKIGNYPEVVCKALGIRYAVFVAWTKRGIADLLKEKDTIFAMFVAAVDAGVAQDEIASMNLITRRVNNWQALAWKLERSKFKRWGQRTAIGVGSLEDMQEQDTQSKLPFDRMGEVLAILEQAGVMPIPPQEIASPEGLTGNIVEITADPSGKTSFDSEAPDTSDTPDKPRTPEEVARDIVDSADKLRDKLRDELLTTKPKVEDEDETVADALREDLTFTAREKPPQDDGKPVDRHSTDTGQHLPGHSRRGR